MIQRLLTAAAAGTSFTLALLYGMSALIDLGIGAETEPRPEPNLVFVREPEPTLLEHLDQPPPRIPEPIEPPSTPRPETNSGGGGITLTYTSPPTPGKTTRLPFFALVSDGPLVNVVRVQPAYPMHANGREGHVLVEYTVLADGTTAEHRVVESSHRVFEKEAVRAAERFRYKPRVVDGMPIATPGVQILFRFQVEAT